MVRDSRIKNYYIESIVGSSAFASLTTNHVLNGELLRVSTLGNYTGSLQISESGTGLQFLNVSLTSGTSNWKSYPFDNSTGSYMINTNLIIAISGASGTGAIYGPVEVLYR